MKQRLLAFSLALLLSAVSTEALAFVSKPIPEATKRPQRPSHATYSAPYAGLPNHAHAAPAFQWGWFGAERFAPTPQRHRGYYGTPMKWSNQRW